MTVNTNFRPSEIHIDLNAITHNVEQLKKFSGDSKFSVAVKSNAYGHGLVRVSQHLQSIGVDMLLVATPDEALELRDNGIEIPIMVLSEVTAPAIKPCLERNITFTVYTPEFISNLEELASKDTPGKVHLKINTGMNRVGCEPYDVIKLAKQIQDSENLELEGVFTHFATADEDDETGFKTQSLLFEFILDDLENEGIVPEIIHSCNSAATIRYPNAKHNMVRVGLAVYGVYPKAGMEKVIDLKPALSLKSQVTFIKTVQPHQKISYGWKYEFAQKTDVATIPIGYGDGVPQKLGMNGGTVLINGQRCPIVGVVTMDQLMVDIGAIDTKLGDEVVLIGEDISVNEWAKMMNSISWEILCDFSARLPRIYD